MKKIISLIYITIFLSMMIACTESTYEIAMITVYSDINDGSFNQATWDGIKEYAVKNNITHQHYTSKSNLETDYLDTIEHAIDKGAKVIVTAGLFYGFEKNYPDTTFIILDGVEGEDGTQIKTEDNVLTIFFNEHESGFLAGYATVKEGFTNLGFMGGMQINTVIKFGVGFVSGAYYAAKELNKDINFKAEHYEYLNSFDASNQIVEKANTWYQDNIEVIHSAAGGAGLSVIKAAENHQKWVVGVDIDQSRLSKQILTSAVKGLGAATYKALSAFYSNELKQGGTWYMGADESAISLPMENSRFNHFSQSDYEILISKIKDGDIVVPATKVELSHFLTSIQVENQSLINKV